MTMMADDAIDFDPEAEVAPYTAADDDWWRRACGEAADATDPDCPGCGAGPLLASLPDDFPTPEGAGSAVGPRRAAERRADEPWTW